MADDRNTVARVDNQNDAITQIAQGTTTNLPPAMPVAPPVAKDDFVSMKEDMILALRPSHFFGADGAGGNNDSGAGPFKHITITELPSNGVLTLNWVPVKANQVISVADLAAGNLRFAPKQDFNGDVSLKYSVTDANTVSNVATMHIQVSAVADAPVAINDRLTTQEDSALKITAAQLFGSDGSGKQNDFSADGKAFTHIVIKELATHGTLKLDGVAVTDEQIVRVADLEAGKLTFVPDANYRGEAVFKYAVSDGSRLSNIAKVSINVTGVNDAPVARNDVISMQEDGTRVVSAKDILGNDGDVDSDKFVSITITALPAHAKLILTTAEHAPKEIKAGDVVSVSDLNAGHLSIKTEGNFSGSTLFKYTVSDGKLSSKEASVTVNVAANNDAPVAVDDKVAGHEDESIMILGQDFFGTDGVGKNNDYDVDSANFTHITIKSLPTGGSLMLDGVKVALNQKILVSDLNAGKLMFEPTKNFSGDTGFKYTVSDGKLESNVANMKINIHGMNDAPVANNDTIAIKDNAKHVMTFKEILGNDVDADGDKFTSITLTSAPQNGMFVLKDSMVLGAGAKISVADIQAGKLVFYPSADYKGDLQFKYTVSDGKLSSNEATVTLKVGPVNEAPVAKDDVISMSEEGKHVMTVKDILGNDTDADGDKFTSITLTSIPPKGMFVLDGDMALTPGAKVSVADIAAGKLVFHAGKDFSGDMQFKYTVSDGKTSSNEATVTVKVGAVNDAPVAKDDHVNAVEDTKLTISKADLLGNDSDVDSTLSSIKVTSLASNGTLSLDGKAVALNQVISVADLSAGKLTFTPNANFNGDAKFKYTVSDGKVSSNEATVTVKVGAVNDAPVAKDDTFSMAEEGKHVMTVKDILGNDTDADGDKFTSITLTSIPAKGMFILDGDMALTPGAKVSVADIDAGKLVFHAGKDFSGDMQFKYTVSDGKASSNEATVTVKVGAVNDAPVAKDDHVNAVEDTKLTISKADLLGNDSDVDSTLSSIKVTSLASNGTLSLDGKAVALNQVISVADLSAGKLTFTPNANFNGDAKFKYTVSDGKASSNEASVTIHVGAKNDAPVAKDDTFSMAEEGDHVMTVKDILGNDTDADGDKFTSITLTSIPPKGMFVLDGDMALTPGAKVSVADIAAGKLVFHAGKDFSGDMQFKYTVSDGKTSSNEATVTVKVGAVNDAPVAKDDTFSMAEEGKHVMTVKDILGNDTDADGDKFTSITLTSIPPKGMFVLDGDMALTPGAKVSVADIAAGKLVFHAGKDFSGDMQFKYTVSDGKASSNEATVTVKVGAVNDAPVAKDDHVNAAEDTKLTLSKADLLGNDSDVDSTLSSIKVTSLASNGTLSLDGKAVALNQVISVADLSAGKLTFTPNANFNGDAKFKYTVSDGKASSNEASVTIHVGAKNDAPVAKDDTFSMAEEGKHVMTVKDILGNDTDADGDKFTSITLTSIPPKGMFVLDGDMALTPGAKVSVADIAAGKLVFHAGKDFSGDMQFKYTVSDGKTSSNEATVTVKVGAVNDAPVAKDDTFSMAEEGKHVMTVKDILGNDTDADGDKFTSITLTSIPPKGMFVLDGDMALTPGAKVSVADIAAGKLVFHAGKDFSGDMQFKYTVSDGKVSSNEATVTVKVGAVNDAPVAKDDHVNAVEDTKLTISKADLLGNDSDVDSTLSSIKVTSLASNGTLSLDGKAVALNQVISVADLSAGKLTFTPNANFNGDAKFKYTVSDGKASSNEASVTIHVGAKNDAPVAKDDTFSMAEEGKHVMTVKDILGNDTDADGDKFTSITLTSIPPKGMFVLDGDMALTPGAKVSVADIDAGKLVFHAGKDFTGDMQFKYTVSDGKASSNEATVTVKVGAVNDAPVAKDDHVNAVEDTKLTISKADLLGNDSDVDSTLSSIKVTSLASNGTLSLDGKAVTLNQVISVADLSAGKLTFTPNANFNGDAKFKYTVSDGALSSNEALVTIHVGAKNDAPVAKDDTIAATEDKVLTISKANLLGNDTDDAGITSIKVTALASNGTLKLNGEAVTANQVVTVADLDAGKLTFTPNANFNGAANFKYSASDGSLSSNEATVTINVGAANDAPVAKDDHINAVEDVKLTISKADLLGNDTDADSSTLSSIKVTALASNGTLSLNGTAVTLNQVISVADLDAGKLAFTPKADFNGDANFKYTVSDGVLSSNEASVTIHVAARNDAPVVHNDVINATEDKVLTIKTADILGNDVDVDSKIATIKVTDLASNGVLKLNGVAVTKGQLVLVSDLDAGKLTFTPNANFNGAANFKYRASDGMWTSNEATVTINVGAANDAPVAQNDSIAATEDTVLTISKANLLGNDTDDVGISSIKVTSLASNGTLKLNGVNVAINQVISVADLNGGKLTFTPDANFNGAAHFKYTAGDGSLSSNEATVTINVAAVNDAPVAVNDTIAATEDTVLTISRANLLGNDTDDAGITSIKVTSLASNGTLKLNGVAVTDEQVISVSDLNAGKLSFTPNADFHGVANFKYTASDGSLSSNEATVTINVAAQSSAPVAKDDHIQGIENKSQVISVQQLLGVDGTGKYNDYAVGASSFSHISITNLPDHGSLKLNGVAVTQGQNISVADLTAGKLTFEPTANYSGDSNFKYTVTANGQISNVATVHIHVADYADLGANLVSLSVASSNNYNQDPAIAQIGSDGKYATAWMGEDQGGDMSIYVQRFNANGTVLGDKVKLEAIGVTAGHDVWPNITAVGSTGAFVVSWGSEDSNGTSAYLQLFKADGSTPASIKLDTLSNSTGAQQVPHVTALGSDGGFVVTWDGMVSGTHHAFAQRFDANGATNGTLKDLGLISANQATDSTALGSSGAFVTAHTSSTGVVLSKFNADGSSAGTKTVEAASPQDVHVVSVGSQGAYAVTWQAKESATSKDLSIFVQKFSVDGSSSNLIKLEEKGIDGGEDAQPRVIELGSNGQFLVCWSGENLDGDYNVLVQKFNADGSTNGNAIRLNSGSDAPFEWFPEVAALGNDGAFAVTWSMQGGNPENAVCVQKFEADGSRHTPILLDASNYQSSNDIVSQKPQISAVGDKGAFVVSWQELDAEGHSSIQVQKFNSDGTWETNPRNNYSDGDDFVRAGADDMALSGGLGADTFVWHFGDVPAGTHADFVKDFNTGESLDLSDLVSHGASLVIDNVNHTVTAQFTDSASVVHTQLIEVSFDSSASNHNLLDVGGGVIKIG